MYDQGGVYLDCKSAAKNLCSLILPHDGMILSSWMVPMHVTAEFGEEYSQFWLACAPGNPLMLEIIKETVRRINAYPPGSEGGVVKVHETTGPLMMRDVIRRTKPNPHMRDYRPTCPMGNNTIIFDFEGGYRKRGSTYFGKTDPVVCSA
jgi:hypothetical protein